MRSNTISTITFTTLIALANAPLITYGDTYSFGGSCPSQGAWTKIALEQTQNISVIVRQLKDNPACKGIESVIGDLHAAATILESPKDEEAQTSKLESLPTEIGALRHSILNGKNHVDSGSASMLMNRTMQAAEISSQLDQTSSKLPGKLDFLTSGKALRSLFSRMKAPTQKGMELVNRIFTVLPKFDECLIGQPQQGMAIFAGAVKVAAAFSASGEGVGDSLGNSIANLTTMLRDRRFTLALRKLDETQFWFSVSCLIESSTKNYCDAEEAQEILAYSKDQYKEAMKRNLENRQDPSYDNPLEGYYLLVRELPMISGWLQQVQFGVTPKLSTDADFKNKILDRVTSLSKAVNDLAGYFNEQMIFMRQLPDVNSRRNQIFNIIDDISDRMTKGGENSSSQFFTTTVNPTLLPFYLIGLDTIPSQCRSNDSGKIVMEWSSWMKTGGRDGGFQSQFDDPDKLAITVQARMNEVIAGAAQKSSAYFREQLVIDMPNLVNQTLTGQYMTVRKAFENTYNYLTRFEAKINKDNLDLVLIPSVRETRTKILKFLRSYDDLRKLGEKMVREPTQTDAMLKQVNTAAQKVVDTVFDEFNILFQKDTFLTNRLTTYINKDFSMRIKAGINMTQYQNDLLVISQKHLLDQLIEVHGINPTSSKIDLDHAQVVNKRNLESLEEVFKDSLYKMILDVKSVADGKGRAEVASTLREMRSQEIANFRRNISWRFFNDMNGVAIHAFAWLSARSVINQKHPDLFQAPYNPRVVSGIDDKHGSFEGVRAELCAQTLAFEDRGYYYHLCKGAVLKSYYSDSGKDSEDLDFHYDHYMPSLAYAKEISRNAELKSKSICAYNHFTIRNIVKALKDQDSEMLQDSGTY